MGVILGLLGQGRIRGSRHPRVLHHLRNHDGSGDWVRNHWMVQEIGCETTGWFRRLGTEPLDGSGDWVRNHWMVQKWCGGECAGGSFEGSRHLRVVHHLRVVIYESSHLQIQSYTNPNPVIYESKSVMYVRSSGHPRVLHHQQDRAGLGLDIIRASARRGTRQVSDQKNCHGAFAVHWRVRLIVSAVWRRVRIHPRPFEPSIKSHIWKISSTFGNKYTQNGSKNDTMAPRTTLECPHEGPSVVRLAGRATRQTPWCCCCALATPDAVVLLQRSTPWGTGVSITSSTVRRFLGPLSLAVSLSRSLSLSLFPPLSVYLSASLSHTLTHKPRGMG